MTQNVTDANDKNMTPKVTENQPEDANDVALLSPVFFQILPQTCVIVQIYVTHDPLEGHLFPQNHRLQSLVMTREKQQKVIDDLILNLMLILTSDDLMV